MNRVRSIGLGNGKTVHLQFYILDRPNHPTADNEKSLDDAIFDLNDQVNKRKLIIDLGSVIGVTSRFIGNWGFRLFYVNILTSILLQ